MSEIATVVPEIRKAAHIDGRTLCFRNAAMRDAEFIFGLRTDPLKSRHLSKVHGGIEEQRTWLAAYAVATDQAYFIVERSGTPIGTVRLYDARERSFCWGSWILTEDAPPHAALESALMVYAYATHCLGFSESHFDVRRANENVWRFHESFGAIRQAETDIDFIYRLSEAAIQSSLLRYRRFLPQGVAVEYLG